MSDGVHAQSYYMLANGKSASDYIFEGKLKFSMGNAFKYVSRCGRKENNTAESDLNKALVYVLSSDKEFSFIERFKLHIRNSLLFHDDISDDKDVDHILRAIIKFEDKENIARMIVRYMKSRGINVKPEYKHYE